MNKSVNTNFATFIGICAIILWGSMVALLNKISQIFTPILSVPLAYSLSTLILSFIFKFPNIKNIPKLYLVLGLALFGIYELSFSFAIAYTTTPIQTIEVSILNYLWPCLTVVAMILVKEMRFNWFVLVGLFICLYGIVYIQTGGDFKISTFLDNAKQNPLSYSLATIGAFIWAGYCVVVKKLSKGHNPIVFFFIITALVMWLKFFIKFNEFDASLLNITPMSWIYLLAAGLSIGLGYGAWNYGMMYGNISIIVVSSYFTPILSSFVAMLLLNAKLSAGFWFGVFMVCFGSLICYLSTNQQFLKYLGRLKH